MAKKTPTKPKKVPKAVESALHVPFDLNIDSKEKAENLVAHLIQLQGTAGWMIITQILGGNVAVIEKQIVLGEGIDGTKLTNEQAEDLRKVRKVMVELIEKPAKLIEQFREQEGVKIPTYDPYATDMVQFRRNVDHEFAGTLKP